MCAYSELRGEVGVERRERERERKRERDKMSVNGRRVAKEKWLQNTKVFNGGFAPTASAKDVNMFKEVTTFYTQLTQTEKVRSTHMQHTPTHRHTHLYTHAEGESSLSCGLTHIHADMQP